MNYILDVRRPSKNYAKEMNKRQQIYAINSLIKSFKHFKRDLQNIVVF